MNPLVPMEDPLTGLSQVGDQFTTIIGAFIVAVIMWQILKVMFKSPGIATVCAAIFLGGMVWYAAKGGGIADIGSAVGSFVHKYILGQKG